MLYEQCPKSFPCVQGSHCLPYSIYGENILYPTVKTLFTEIWKPKIFQKKLPKRHHTYMYVTDKLHLRPMQGRRKRCFGAGWRSRGTRSGGGFRLQDSMFQVSQSPNIAEECQPTPQIWSPKRLQACPKIRWCEAESQRAATLLWDESGPRGISVFCSSPATEGFPVASTLIGLDGSYSHVKSPVPWLGMSFQRGKVRKLWKIIMGLSKYSAGESMTWGYFGSFRARRQRRAAAWAPACFLQLFLAKPRRHLKMG